MVLMHQLDSDVCPRSLVLMCMVFMLRLMMINDDHDDDHDDDQ